MFKGGMENLMGQLQQAQEKLQEQMKKNQQELEQLEIKGEAGAGMVAVAMNGRYDVRRVSIDPSLLKEDKEMLEDLIAAAVNDAVRKVEAESQKRMGSLTDGLGLNIPGGFKPF
ncbi:YbaB/EbfC family nucleoid-associated protein [Zooshikella marina]|uniref:YbaB/EbfC family nucleoid-associated protein n=1 Tax=Zooshikella ganghwensis TaxID=202772 RepID=UPI0004098B96|nr:YbaB/EbfC family nucleoid-associated protein [Zooshikella ganghwensis]MBU2707045.1 YbaB/EbfC family nucleoid-associated protein [Zooshikella ganghwensis]